MYKKKDEIDIVEKILTHCYKALSMDLFVMSLMHQYEERGSLSKKQLQGLYQKALKAEDIPQNLMATLQAKILKMPNRFKQPQETITVAPVKKNDTAAALINAILAKYPAHKRVLFFQSKFNHNDILSAHELNELQQFGKLLLK